MHRYRAHTDLRLNRSGQATDSAMWPSFTDIMTVILMVFMLTMVVVIIKNADLIDQIRLSRKLQADAEQQLSGSQQVLADLRVQKTDLEEAIRSARMQIILLSDEMQYLDDSLDIKAAAIARLSEQNEELSENIRLIRLQLSDKEEELEDAQAMIGGIRDEAEAANRELSLQIAALLSQLETNEATMLMLSDEKSDLERSLARQRQDFSSLEEKYLDLVRPARSSLGKQVVSVQHLRSDGQLEYLLKDIGGTGWERVTRADLFSRLGALAERLGDQLYVRVVIPDDSGLTYNEAWDFTKTVLSDYDYYYIGGW